jgi:hypothetical protein
MSLGQLAKALAAAQGEILAAPKTSLNPHFRSKYSDLAEVWNACRDALSKHKIAVMQVPQFEGETAWLETVLAHESGETITGRFPLRPTKFDMQGLGSAISYARRYSLSAMVGVISELDDDAEQASGRTNTQTPTQAKPVAAPSPRPVVAQAPTNVSTASPPSEGFNPTDAKHLKSLIGELTKRDIKGQWQINVIKAMAGKKMTDLETTIKACNPEAPDEVKE